MSENNIEYVEENLVARKLNSNSSEHKLICFPPAGGFSLSFKPLANELSHTWEVWGIDPPGHGLSQGSLLHSVNEMATYYFKKLQFLFHGRFSLLGHSLGGLVAYALGKKLESLCIYPTTVIICATEPPHRIATRTKMSTLTDADLVNKLVKLNGLPADVLKYEHLLKGLLPLVRADLLAFEHFSVDLSEEMMRTPIWLFGGTADPLVCLTTLQEWDRYGVNTTCFLIEGNHFFVQLAARATAKILEDKMREIK